MANKKGKKQIEQYEHSKKKRANIPHVGLVTPDSDPDTGEKKTYEYDPHLDPQLQWAGKAEHTSFEVPTVSLHVHERIDPKTIIETVKKEHDDGGQMSLFSEKKPLREAIDFYKHKEGWTNRLIAGDSLLVMNSLLEKEGMAGKVQMVYFDPPYGIKYGSNFMPFINKRDVRDGKDEDLNLEPEMIKAFRDTWELGIHSYLSYIRDRLNLAHELLSETGSIFIQISDENVHLVRNILDEVFGPENFIAQIRYKTKKMTFGTKFLESIGDHILYYSKDKTKAKFHPLFAPKDWKEDQHWRYIELPNGERRTMTKDERENTNLIPSGSKVFIPLDLRPSGFNQSGDFEYTYNGTKYHPGPGKSWKTNKEGMDRIAEANRFYETKTSLTYVLYFDDFPVSRLTNFWTDTEGAYNPLYVVQTANKIVQRCMLQTTDPGDVILDITCGSGTSAYVAEQWGRRWITCDTSRISLNLAKQRLMTAEYNYYELQHPISHLDLAIFFASILFEAATNPN